MDLVPKQVFLTKGVGRHKEQLCSFELALRNAGIAKCNIVCVSSIIPPGCRLIQRRAGLRLLKPGQITFVVMARRSCNEARLIASAIGCAMPIHGMHGFLAEHASVGEDCKRTGSYAEQLAATMLSSASGKVKNIKTSSIAQAARCRSGIWTTVVAAAVLLI
ncbi:arginine decarboxylase, pyruvoyl-dependent [Candidatus Woesearchaeota archaeon CG08_land_8_20_14_0_20_47_9]|nr:MAG: arginine decarboxylase, pyruvoyl-dependent [Candidatus Woesearchaeota archaeon CG08_land_8_20_14_0_20_47_9]